MNRSPSVRARLAVSSIDWLGALVALRRDADIKVRLHRLEKPGEKQGLMALKARKNGIQACINEMLRLQRAAPNDKAQPLRAKPSTANRGD